MFSLIFFVKILLFVSSRCSHCPGAERIVKEVVPEYSDYGVSFEKIRMKTGRGKRLSSEFNIMAVPTVLMLDDGGNEAKRVVGAPTESSLRNEIEKNLGLRKSFFDRILGR
ncbi:MAG: thioredoxin family protein [Candidatus Altiarchaeales archaeon]|nr:thioredoxin family protein [Candidatus Altiarchaeales archaeon]